MELEILELSVSCRLCLAACTDGSTALDNPDLVERLRCIFSKPFCINEWFPKIVCKTCEALVNDFFKFVRKVNRSQEYLESLKLPEGGDDSANLDNVDSDEGASNGDGNLIVEQVCDSELATNIVENEEQSVKLIPPIKKSSKEDDLINQYYKIQCEICLTESSNFNALLLHFREEHNTSGYIKCCNKKLYRRCRLLEHISRHLNPEAFRCSICDKNYSSKDGLDLHNMSLHLPEDQKPYKCSKCPQAFAKEFQLNAHAVRHKAAECPECGKILSNRISLKEHLQKIHRESGPERSLVCDTCGRQFRSKPTFRRHIQQHQGLAEQNRAQCGTCRKWFSNKEGLRQHVRTQHQQSGEIFVCGICGKIKQNSTALRQHHSVVHGERKYKCGLCRKSFRREISLKEHRAAHTGDSLYSCKLCPTKFNSNANMYKHLKTVHRNAWLKNKKIQTPNQEGN